MSQCVVGNQWNTPLNWDMNAVPPPEATVIINGGFPNVVGLGVFSQYELILRGGTLTSAGMNVQRLTVTNATLSGGVFNIPSSARNFFHWEGGTLLEPTINVGSNASFILSGEADRTLFGGVINSAGPGTWSGSGLLKVQGGVINNSGTFTVLGDAPVVNYTGNVTTFINTGTFRKAGGTNTVFHSLNGGMEFNNSGTVSVQSGVLTLGGGGAGTNGTFDVASGSRIDWTAGNVFLKGTLAFSGAGTNRVNGAALTFVGGTSMMSGGNTFEVSAGSVVGTNSFAGAGTFHWNGGSIMANLSLAAGVSFHLSGEAARTLDGGVISSAGAGTRSGAGQLLVSYGVPGSIGAVINNSGTFTVLGDAQAINYTGGPAAFNNTGIFVKAGGTNTFFHPLNGGMEFNNSGIVDLRSGVMTASGGYRSSPTSQLKLALGGMAPGTQFSQLNMGGAVALAGTLSVSLTNNFTPTNGQSFAIVGYGSRTGQFTSTHLPPLPPELQWSLNYGATTLTLSVTRPHRVSSLGTLANGHFQFMLSGPPASRAIIDASENIPSWQPIQTNAPFTGMFLFDDADAVNHTNRLYRVRIEP